MFDITVPADDRRFEDAFNRRAFLFSHDLHLHPFYDLGSLVELGRRLGPSSAYWSTRAAEVSDGWEDRAAKEQSLEQAIAGIEHGNTLVVLKAVERDRVFGPVFEQVVADMAARIGPAFQGDVAHGRATLLVSSPGRVTGYHIDAEANFLLQLRGSKVVHVFDGSDRSVVPEHELEAFYAGDLNGARYKAEQQERALTVDFQPGIGVHVPVEWPHWVKNGSDYSVSISINYDLRSVARRARVFRANRRMRKLGLSPVAPGSSAWRDMGKNAVMRGLERLTHRSA